MSVMLHHLRRFGLFYVTCILVLISLYPSYLIIDKPFIIGNHLAGVPALQGTFNENVRQHGYLKLKFGALEGYMKDDRCPRGFYINHPTLSLVLHSIPTLVLGDDEWVIRSVALSFHILNLFLIYLIGRLLFDRVTGLLMVIVYAFFPVNMLYNTLPTYHGTSFLTAPLLIIYFILKFDQKQKRAYKISFFAVYFLSLFHDWLSVVNSFIIVCYYVLSHREKIYEGLFYVLALTVLAFSLNLAHIYILTGRVMVNELIGAELFRASAPLSYVYSDYFRHTLGVAFGGVLMLVIPAAVLFHKIENKNFRAILYSQVLSSLFLLLFLRMGISMHFFLFTNFSLLILMSVTTVLKFFEGDNVLVALVVFLMVLDNQIIMSGMRNETSLEIWDHFVYQYELAEKFFASGKYDNNTLVLLRDPSFYVSDYHFGRRGYCYDMPPQNPSDYNRLKGFDKIVFIELDENKSLLVQDLSPVV